MMTRLHRNQARSTGKKGGETSRVERARWRWREVRGDAGMARGVVAAVWGTRTIVPSVSRAEGERGRERCLSVQPCGGVDPASHVHIHAHSTNGLLTDMTHRHCVRARAALTLPRPARASSVPNAPPQRSAARRPATVRSQCGPPAPLRNGSTCERPLTARRARWDSDRRVKQSGGLDCF